MAEYRQSAHAVFDLKYHMICCTKYRKKVLRGRIAERARDLIRQICSARDVVIIRGSVSPDHIKAIRRDSSRRERWSEAFKATLVCLSRQAQQTCFKRWVCSRTGVPRR